MSPHTAVPGAVVNVTDVGEFTVTMLPAAKMPQLLVIVYDITAVPVARPVTKPFVPIVATELFVLLHTPPVALSLSSWVEPRHTACVPVIVVEPGVAFTVSAIVAEPVHPAVFTTVSVGV